ncbi:hypothetical protein [Microcoleus sp. PH2017_30_WIL_O_A]|uniref:hypothetical protein n=1 Tax=Microcoleus sp. PH2017_30_WIL_O_A TaxID=2798840 RepID=UPI001D53F538|nr:hypothetical protein [Microcoleus sp. PH2017_30_WIL_O_A]MCC3582671.1 hypothetical protein [Microcoleus sp. PH2017_30_WIL_O_A]
MQRPFTVLETALISLLVANFINSIYLEPKTNAAVAAPGDRPSSIIPTTGICECPRTPRGK